MNSTDQLPPQAVMMQMVNGQLVSRCVCLTAELGIADLLKDGPQEIAALAASTGADEDALYRVLRMLAGLGIFTELPDRRFEQSPLSEALCGDSPGSVRHYARWFGTAFHWRFVGDLDYSVRTGRPAINKDHPDMMPFEVLSKDNAAQATFNDAMTGLSRADGAAVVAAYDFSAFSRIMDVGGGHGMLASLIAQATPGAGVSVFDMPHVIEGTAKRLAAEPTTSGIKTEAGDFMNHIPGPVDLCILKHIIHDWNDTDAARILETCRKALAPGGRVLVCEMIVTEGPEGMPAKVLDIEMLVGPGGRERTEAEFAALFNQAGLKLERVVETRTPIRLLEAVMV